MYSDIVDAVVAVLQGVADSGKVYGYFRYAADSSDFLSFFQTTIGGVSQLRGWLVTLAPRDPMTVTDWALGTSLERYQVLATGIMGVNDAQSSERTFSALCETVTRTLSHCDLALSGVVSQEAEPAAWRLAEHRLFGGTLCHYAEITLPVSVTRAG